MEERTADSVELSAAPEVKTEGCRLGCEHRVQATIRPAEWCVGFRAGRR